MTSLEDVKKELCISHDELDIISLLDISIEEILDRFEDKLLNNLDAACLATGLAYETVDQTSEEDI